MVENKAVLWIVLPGLFRVMRWWKYYYHSKEEKM